MSATGKKAPGGNPGASHNTIKPGQCSTFRQLATGIALTVPAWIAVIAALAVNHG
ncbi:hypothetical protein [Acidithiobacillus sp.]|uniref:hypothetical protein n=1 Tax=Acidithiobacillus sp. TaxID=1872118 RepID=UPI0025BAE52E|nr:hypothetical protein [Acidithiobacillus sp.]